MMDDRRRTASGVVKLRCAVQNYAWGRNGEQSAAGRVYASQSQSPLVPDKPYAELWMGTHGSGPSFVVLGEEHDAGRMHKPDMRNKCFSEDRYAGDVNRCDGDDNHCCANVAREDCRSNDDCNGNEVPRRVILLKDWLSENPAVLGDKVIGQWGSELPFLFKVLSIQKALSIQAHPDKQLAERLHQLHPNIYKDANHKPEMAFAITHFEALCGFLSPQEMQVIIEMVPELQHILGVPLSHALLNMQRSSEKDAKRTLKAAFVAIMSASKDIISDVLTQLIGRLEKSQAERSLMPKELLVLRLAEQYPDDVGILCGLFLNYIQLEPGQALYFDANEPHAYLSGECLECMAASDNVVRAGLTPKYIDTKTLCNMLTYKQGMPEILSGVDVNAYTKRYSPPFDEFEMESCLLPMGRTTEFSSVEGPSILLVLEGSGFLSVLDEKSPSEVRLQKGEALFISAATPFNLTVSETSETSLQVYRAGVNSRFLSEG